MMSCFCVLGLAFALGTVDLALLELGLGHSHCVKGLKILEQSRRRHYAEQCLNSWGPQLLLTLLDSKWKTTVAGV